MIKRIVFIGFFSLFAALPGACAPLPDAPVQQPETRLAGTAINTATAFITDTRASTATTTSTQTLTPTTTSTPTITPTPTETATPTFTFPAVVVNTQAHCRYGPSKAYLHAADLYAGDTGTVRGRFEYSSWLYVKFEKLNYFCWVSSSVVDVTGDVSTVYYTEPNLQTIGYNQYGPPKHVTATRDGNRVTITWDRVKMTEDKDRGYFIEAWVCQNGAYLWWTVSFPDQYKTSYTVQDDPGCGEKSSGELLTVEKHGYSDPVRIPWPEYES